MAEINIYNCDCMEFMKALPDKAYDLLVTDPPYFIPAQSYVGTRENGYSKRHFADNFILKGFFSNYFKEIDRILSPTSSVYVFCDAQSYPIFFETAYPYYNHLRLLVWDKLVSFNGYTWRHQHELIMWGEKKLSPRIPTGDGDILRERGVLQENRIHPAEKPVNLLKQIISKYKNQNVIDTFCGSGSAAIACFDVGCDFTGLELDTDYYNAAVERFERHKRQGVLQFD